MFESSKSLFPPFTYSRNYYRNKAIAASRSFFAIGRLFCSNTSWDTFGIFQGSHTIYISVFDAWEPLLAGVWW